MAMNVTSNYDKITENGEKILQKSVPAHNQ